jgi:hypothetical protein
MFPDERQTDLLDVSPNRPTVFIVVDHLIDRFGEGLDVTGVRHRTKTSMLGELGERVSGCQNHREASPEVVQDPRPKRELGLEMRAVGAHPGIGL